MKPWKNGADKRVCDISDDCRIILIKQKGQVTTITANPDGTLKIENITPLTVA